VVIVTNVIMFSAITLMVAMYILYCL